MSMRRTPTACHMLAAIAALTLSGCGVTATNSGSPLATAGAVTVPLRSSAIRGGALPALYTCDGRDISPPLSWGAVPSDIQELALFAVGTKRGGGGQAVASLEWAMAGVKPGLHRLAAGEVPPGAFMLTTSGGRNSYSICPAKGHSESYTFALYALPPIARASTQISGLGLLHNLTEVEPRDDSPASGHFSVTYKRR
jgi:phosphatidylethanolamine-binding protein (PEBP) family uncharacterized protein